MGIFSLLFVKTGHVSWFSCKNIQDQVCVIRCTLQILNVAHDPSHFLSDYRHGAKHPMTLLARSVENIKKLHGTFNTEPYLDKKQKRYIIWFLQGFTKKL